MKVISIITTATAAFSLYLTIVVLRVKPRTISHWLLAVSSFALSWWTFFAFFTYNAVDLRQFRFFFFISIMGLFLFIPMQNYFVCSMTGTIRFWYVFIFAVPAVFLMLKNFDGTVTFSEFYRTASGWVFVRSRKTVWNFLWMVYFIGTFCTGIALLVRWRKKAEYTREYKQINLLIASSTVSLLLSVAEYLLHAHLYWMKTVSISPILLIPWISGYVIAIKRYQFLQITPERITRQILESIDELVIVTDFAGKPMYMNKKALGFFKKPFRKLTETRLDRFFIQPKGGESIIPDFFGDKPIRKRVVMQPSKTPDSPPVLDLAISTVLDKFGEPLGFLLIGKELHGINNFKTEYNLTDREMDIVGGIVSGWKTAIIADRLSITERTVKTHITSIYRKLDVSNRVEIINLAMEK